MGKAPIGEAPVGKTPIGKAPLLTKGCGSPPPQIDNEPPGSDGNSGKVAEDGKVAMAREGDSEPVTPAMIAVGLSQLPPMDETFAHLVETVEAVYRAMRKVEH